MLSSQNQAPGMWQGEGHRAAQYRRTLLDPLEPNVRAFSAAEQIPGPVDRQDIEGNTPVLLNSACPPWLCPPLFSVALDFPTTKCIPWYVVKTLMGDLDIPKGYLLALKSVSYEAANASQDDVVQFEILANGQPVAQWEDMVVDAAQPNPAHRFALCGHIRELPLHIVVAPNSKVSVVATLLGAVDFAGNSAAWPGQPITTGDCHVKMLFNGWFFPAMSNVQGSPRQGFIGDAGNRLISGGM